METLCKVKNETICKMIPLHVIRDIKNPKLVISERGYHIVTFDCLGLLDDPFVKMGLRDPNEWQIAQTRFNRFDQALKFIKLIETHQQR